jgi:protein TonB
METKHILNQDYLDIVFEGKNKLYGAYELRKSYNKRISRALLVTLGIFGVSILAFGLTKDQTIEKPKYVSTEITITEIKEKEVKPPPPPPKEVQTTQPSTVKFTEPIIVDQPTEPLPAQVDMRDAQIGTINVKGDTCQINNVPDFGNGIIDVPYEPEIFEKVEIEASFPGGVEKWKRYLERTLSDVNPADEGAPDGIYTTLIQFVVDVDGNISDVIPLTSHGYGMEEIAIKAIKKGPKWNPAIQNGRQVKAYRKQSITFQVNTL